MIWRRCVMIVGLTVGPGLATAQSAEPEWRAINTGKPRVIPLYAGGSNPFPMIEAVEEQVPQPEFVQNNNPAEDEAKATLAKALENARNLIGSDKVYRPDLSGVRFTGRVDGDAGPKVFSGRQWMGIGSTLTVPVKGVASAYDAIRRLEELDPELAKTVSEELRGRLSRTTTEKLSVRSIENDQVTLTGKDGKQYVIPLRRSSW